MTTGVVITDPQNDFLSQHGATWELVGDSVIEHDTVENLERLLQSPLTTEGLDDSGADWHQKLKPYIADGDTVVTSPHKVYGPQNTDQVLQLRKRGVTSVVLAGMSANLCVESHLRDLIEQGFEVRVVADATAAANHPDMGDGYAAALTNFTYISSGVLTTEEAVQLLSS